MAVATPATIRDHCLAPGRVDAPLGEGGRYGRMFDLPALEADETRNHEGIALIGDPRNDVHAFMSQMQLRFIEAHNALVDRVGGFEEARRVFTWHYQWVILDEFLPILVGRGLVDDVVANGARFYRPSDGTYVPVEFAGAGYRYGHSHIRPFSRLQDGGPLLPVFPDLLGFRPIEDRRIDWS